MSEDSEKVHGNRADSVPASASEEQGRHPHQQGGGGLRDEGVGLDVGAGGKDLSHTTTFDAALAANDRGFSGKIADRPVYRQGGSAAVRIGRGKGPAAGADQGPLRVQAGTGRIPDPELGLETGVGVGAGGGIRAGALAERIHLRSASHIAGDGIIGAFIVGSSVKGDPLVIPFGSI